MFCPVCRDEYRPGFTRCATCDAELVESLDAGAAVRPAMALAEVAADEGTVSFCGFLTLDDARQARDKVRGARMRAEILICDPQGSAANESVGEEYWLRVKPRDFRAVAALVGFPPDEVPEGEETFGCSACGATVHASADACPGCGLRFEE